jgi:predicted RNA-binding protein with PIN domain
MPYLIDGHNLIPHIPGLHLSDLDDENKLIQILSKFASQNRSAIEVFFDQAPAAGSGTKVFGLVKAHYIRSGSTADQAIKNRLSKLGNSAKNWTVVSSDREVLSEAKSYQSQIRKSSDFAKVLTGGTRRGTSVDDKLEQPEISEDEVEFWLNQFDD